MNPGPWRMAQVGIPFGEVRIVRDWMGIELPVKRSRSEHPKRPVEGFACRRSEVSGRRLWGLFRERFESPESFFAEHLVLNYCPLVFMEDSGRNRTPDKLPYCRPTTKPSPLPSKPKEFMVRSIYLQKETSSVRGMN
jgi:single-strand selective monofunctional uracil DNA glycosylase